MNLIEAAASGNYIIATNVRGNADVVKQCGFGTLVELNDDAVMAEEIRKALYMVEEPFSTDASHVFGTDIITSQIITLYSDSLQEGSETNG